MREKQIAVYAGSFDPITKGHEWVMRLACQLFDYVYVLLAVNPKKNPFFSVDEQKVLILESVDDLENLELCMAPGQFTARWAEAQGAQWLIRGMRNTIDLEEEMQILEANRRISDKLHTIYLPASPHGRAVSSSLVRGFVGLEGWRTEVAHYVEPHVIRALHRKVVREELWQRFSSFWQRLDSTSDVEYVFNVFFAKYDEVHRKYHTWQHLLEALECFDQLRYLCENPDAVELALWLHDVVYDIGAKYNEERSAEFARTWCDSVGDVRRQIMRLIMVTKHDCEPTNIDEQVMLDCDLWIFSADKERWQESCEQVRDEYAVVSDEVYNERRSAILGRFVDRDQLYWTDYMRKREERARDNLDWEIMRLNVECLHD